MDLRISLKLYTDLPKLTRASLLHVVEALQRVDEIVTGHSWIANALQYRKLPRKTALAGSTY